MLIALIDFYRRRLSGRGPFDNVHCTFELTESCSAYGLRRAQQATSLARALGEIAMRIRRCGQLSLYRSRLGGVLWDRYYDGRSPATIDRDSHARHERSDTRILILRAALAVAVARGAPGEQAELMYRLSREELLPPGSVVVRHWFVLRQKHTRRFARWLALCLSCAMLPWLLPLPAVVSLTAMLCASLVGVGAWVAYRRETKRLERLLIVDEFVNFSRQTRCSSAI